MRLLITGLLLASPFFASTKEVDHRLDASAAVLSEIMSSPGKGIPEDLLRKAHCIAIVPGMKEGAFIVGAKFGKGFVSCRGFHDAGWSAPAAIRIEGGSVGFQIGGSATDIVMLVMNDRGANKLLSSKFTLGGEGEVAAGPVGRETSADTDVTLHAEILSWSRSRGAFAGVSLQGATLREDMDDNEELYGRKLGNREIINGAVPPPPAASRLMSELRTYSPREQRSAR